VITGMRHKATGNRKFICSVLGAMLLAFGFPAEAQRPEKVPRIGFLAAPSPSFFSTRMNGFREGLYELGHVEGKNIAIEYRYAGGKLDRLPTLAAELVRLKVDVIVSSSAPGAFAAKNATGTIPIVFVTAGDPVEMGLVTSLARPGGNITGLTTSAPELIGKRLELLKEVLPRVTRVAVVWNPSNPSFSEMLKEMQAASKAHALQLQSLEVRGLEDFEGAFESLARGNSQAIIVVTDPLMNTQHRLILDFAGKHRLPAIYGSPEAVDAGGLMSYGPGFSDQYRRAATYVDKILRGTKPARLPVERPMKFELVINLKTAKQIGLTIPDSVLYRADRVIK
jgi:putative tryptophan/tyrosine transport system substrate-binding protein